VDSEQGTGTSKPSQLPAIKITPAIEPPQATRTRPVVEIPSTLQSPTSKHVNGSSIKVSDSKNAAATYDRAPLSETASISNQRGIGSLEESRQNATEIVTITEITKPEEVNENPPALKEEDFEVKQDSDEKSAIADKKSESALSKNGIENQVDYQPDSNQKSNNSVPENVVEIEIENHFEDKSVTIDQKSEGAALKNGIENEIDYQPSASKNSVPENFVEIEIEDQSEDKKSETSKKENGIDNQVNEEPLPNIVQKSKSSVEENVLMAQENSTYELVKPVEKLESSVPTTTECGIPFEVCRVYNNLFLMMHQKTPDIDTDDVLIALDHIELLIRTANYYCCLELIRPYMRDHLLSFGKPLYKAILSDPPHWLQISISLESVSIFQEAIVHIVGQCPYSWEPAIWSCVPDRVMGLIYSKANKLRDLRQTVDRKLTLSGIIIDGLAVSIHEQTFEIWLIECYWRDWFIQALGRADVARKRGEKNVDGAVYRLMVKGGDAYVPIDLLAAEVNVLGHKIHCEEWDWQEAAKDLGLLTDYARKLVKPLCVNHSMLDLEEEGIEYLTCTKVESDEFPWMNQSDNFNPES
jgi:hypothetical protein